MKCIIKMRELCRCSWQHCRVCIFFLYEGCVLSYMPLIKIQMEEMLVFITQNRVLKLLTPKLGVSSSSVLSAYPSVLCIHSNIFPCHLHYENHLRPSPHPVLFSLFVSLSLSFSFTIYMLQPSKFIISRSSPKIKTKNKNHETHLSKELVLSVCKCKCNLFVELWCLTVI